MKENASEKKNEINFNPFVYNAPVRGSDFYNREELINKVLKETVTGKSQGSVWLTGERQVGKTSLLKYLHSRFSELGKAAKKVNLYGTGEQFDTAFIYLNIQENTTRETFYRGLRQSLKHSFDFKLKRTDDPYKDYIAALEYLYFELKYYIVFLIDEFDAFIESLAGVDAETATAFLAELNKLIQGVSEFKNEPKIFSCIFSANHTIEDLIEKNGIKRRGSGLVVESMELPWFDKLRVEALARQYLEDNVIQFSDKEIDFCFNMTGGYPYFVQKLFSLMYDEKTKQPEFENYLKQVKKDYGLAFREMVKGWGSANMSEKNKENLRNLAMIIEKIVGFWIKTNEFLNK
ncbi:MAG: ATP-binding protein [Candidatus Aminicenantes bacterium]|nr:ATP-binding protein [Candidatus Aminicenantes bacterium]